jgi:UDP-N-acetylmuramoylalanine-D-glutamate ligase
MQPDDLAILELSSFQLDQMTISPNIAAILNITPNHLDRHGTMEAYTQAKARMLDFQSDKRYHHPRQGRCRRVEFAQPCQRKIVDL